jgi:hypothetical protein
MFVFIEDNNNNSKIKSFFWGTLLVALGLFFLLKNMGLVALDIPDYILNWRLIVVFLAINALLSKKWSSVIFWGGLATILYASLLLNISLQSLLWPIIIIVVGVFIMVKVKAK